MLQAGGIDFQHSNVVILLAAHQLSGVLGAVGKGDLNGDGGILDCVLNHVVVGNDVAVLGQHKAGTAGGGGGGLAEDVHRGVHGNAHAGGQVGRVELLRSHRLAVIVVDHRLYGGAISLIDHGSAPAQILIQGCTAHAGAAAHDGTGQHQGYDLLGKTSARLLPVLGSFRIGNRGGGINIFSKASPVAVILAIIKVELVVFHNCFTPLWSLGGPPPFDWGKYKGKI